jgi:hypothetical protein
MALLLLALFAGAAGCGGKDNTRKESTRAAEPESRESSEEEGEERGSRALEKIPLADRIAYFQLAGVAGLVRRIAVSIALPRGGSTGRPARATLGAAVARLRKLRPRDNGLAELQVRLLGALRQLQHAGPAANRRIGRSTLQATDLVNSGLRRFASQHPAVGALVPD